MTEGYSGRRSERVATLHEPLSRTPLNTMVPIERDETLAMAWPQGRQPPSRIELPPGYTLRTAVDHAAFKGVQASIGFEVSDAAWGTLTERLVSGSMVFAETSETHEPVAVAAAERVASGWVELGWVAVAPAHRGQGLGLAVCSSLIARLTLADESRLWGSTQDHRLAALRIYFTLGFHPVFRPEKLGRWREVCARLDRPFSRDVWGWPSGVRREPDDPAPGS